MSSDPHTARAKVAAQAAGVSYGCHVDLAEDEEPDGCVKDTGDDFGCTHARRHKTREGCRYWLPIRSTTND